MIGGHVGLNTCVGQTGHNSIKPSSQSGNTFAQLTGAPVRTEQGRRGRRGIVFSTETSSSLGSACKTVAFLGAFLPSYPQIDRPLICSTASKIGHRLPSKSVSPSPLRQLCAYPFPFLQITAEQLLREVRTQHPPPHSPLSLSLGPRTTRVSVPRTQATCRRL